MEGERSIDEARRRLHRLLPDDTIERIAPLHNGFSHQNFLVYTHSGRYVLKLLNTQNCLLTPQPYCELTELFAALNREQLTPVTLIADDHCQLSQFIDGQHWPDTPTKTQIENLGLQLAKLHQLPTRHCGLKRIPLLAYWQDYEARFTGTTPLHKAYPHWLQLAKLCAENLEKMTDSAVICHQDLHADNLLVSQSSLYFIDWEYAALNNRHWDLASIVENLTLTTEQLANLWSAYRQAFKWNPIDQQQLLLATFCIRFTEYQWWFLQAQDGKQKEAIAKVTARLAILYGAIAN